MDSKLSRLVFRPIHCETVLSPCRTVLILIIYYTSARKEIAQGLRIKALPHACTVDLLHRSYSSSSTSLAILSPGCSIHAIDYTTSLPHIIHASLATLSATSYATRSPKRTTQSPTSCRRTGIPNTNCWWQPQAWYLVFSYRQDSWRRRWRVAESVSVKAGEE